MKELWVSDRRNECAELCVNGVRKKELCMSERRSEYEELSVNERNEYEWL